MAERGDWMPGTLAGKRAMVDNIMGKIPGHAAALGLAAGQVSVVQLACEGFLAVYDYAVEFASTAQAVNEWRDDMMNGDKGKTLPNPPAVAAFTNDPAYITGFLAQLREWREQWVAANGYTLAIGEDLMIVATKGDAPDPATLAPTVRADAAQSGYLVALVVADRAESDQWTVEIRKNGGTWQNAGTFVGKSADITVTPTTPGQPEQVEIRVQLRRKNANYGNLSQIATVTVNP